jgi:hypothetical protein
LILIIDCIFALGLIGSLGVVGIQSIISERVLSDTIYCMGVAARRLHLYNSIDVVFVSE